MSGYFQILETGIIVQVFLEPGLNNPHMWSNDLCLSNYDIHSYLWQRNEERIQVHPELFQGLVSIYDIRIVDVFL